jgi:hypothetical protein
MTLAGTRDVEEDISLEAQSHIGFAFALGLSILQDVPDMVINWTACMI